jgi:hypothetical protein
MTARYAEKQLQKKEKKMRQPVEEFAISGIGRAVRAASVPLRRSKAGTAARLARGRITRKASKFAAATQKTAPRRFAAEVAKSAGIQTGAEVASHAATMRAKKAMDPEYKQNLDNIARQQRQSRQNAKGGVRPSYESILEAAKKKKGDGYSQHKHHSKHNAHIALMRADGEGMAGVRKRLAAIPKTKADQRTRTNTRAESIDAAADRIHTTLNEIAPAVAAVGAGAKAAGGWVARKVASEGAKKVARGIAVDAAAGAVSNKIANKISKPKT